MSKNWATIENGCEVIDFSSEILNNSIKNILRENLNDLWITNEMLPQWFCLHLKNSYNNITIRTIGWNCWHGYNTNPYRVKLHVSSDGDNFKLWDILIAEKQCSGTQLFCCAPLSTSIYPFIVFEIIETFNHDNVVPKGECVSYMNRIYLYTDEIPPSPASKVYIHPPSTIKHKPNSSGYEPMLSENDGVGGGTRESHGSVSASDRGTDDFDMDSLNNLNIVKYATASAVQSPVHAGESLEVGKSNLTVNAHPSAESVLKSGVTGEFEAVESVGMGSSIDNLTSDYLRNPDVHWDDAHGKQLFNKSEEHSRHSSENLLNESAMSSLSVDSMRLEASVNNTDTPHGLSRDDMVLGHNASIDDEAIRSELHTALGLVDTSMESIDSSSVLVNDVTDTIDVGGIQTHSLRYAEDRNGRYTVSTSIDEYSTNPPPYSSSVPMGDGQNPTPSPTNMNLEESHVTPIVQYVPSSNTYVDTTHTHGYNNKNVTSATHQDPARIETHASGESDDSESLDSSESQGIVEIDEDEMVLGSLINNMNQLITRISTDDLSNVKGLGGGKFANPTHNNDDAGTGSPSLSVSMPPRVTTNSPSTNRESSLKLKPAVRSKGIVNEIPQHLPRMSDASTVATVRIKNNSSTPRHSNSALYTYNPNSLEFVETIYMSPDSTILTTGSKSCGDSTHFGTNTPTTNATPSTLNTNVSPVAIDTTNNATVYDKFVGNRNPDATTAMTSGIVITDAVSDNRRLADVAMDETRISDVSMTSALNELHLSLNEKKGEDVNGLPASAPDQTVEVNERPLGHVDVSASQGHSNTNKPENSKSTALTGQSCPAQETYLDVESESVQEEDSEISYTPLSIHKGVGTGMEMVMEKGVETEALESVPVGVVDVNSVLENAKKHRIRSQIQTIDVSVGVEECARTSVCSVGVGTDAVYTGDSKDQCSLPRVNNHCLGATSSSIDDAKRVPVRSPVEPIRAEKTEVTGGPSNARDTVGLFNVTAPMGQKSKHRRSAGSGNGTSASSKHYAGISPDQTGRSAHIHQDREQARRMDDLVRHRILEKQREMKELRLQKAEVKGLDRWNGATSGGVSCNVTQPRLPLHSNSIRDSRSSVARTSSSNMFTSAPEYNSRTQERRSSSAERRSIRGLSTSHLGSNRRNPRSRSGEHKLSSRTGPPACDSAHWNENGRNQYSTASRGVHSAVADPRSGTCSDPNSATLPNPSSNTVATPLHLDSLKKIENMMEMVLQKLSDNTTNTNNINGHYNNGVTPGQAVPVSQNATTFNQIPNTKWVSQPSLTLDPSAVTSHPVTSSCLSGPNTELVDIVHELYRAILCKKYKEMELSSLLAHP